MLRQTYLWLLIGTGLPRRTLGFCVYRRFSSTPSSHISSSCHNRELQLYHDLFQACQERACEPGALPLLQEQYIVAYGFDLPIW